MVRKAGTVTVVDVADRPKHLPTFAKGLRTSTIECKVQVFIKIAIF
jgi:hypothetical protein